MFEKLTIKTFFAITLTPLFITFFVAATLTPLNHNFFGKPMTYIKNLSEEEKKEYGELLRSAVNDLKKLLPRRQRIQMDFNEKMKQLNELKKKAKSNTSALNNNNSSSKKQKTKGNEK